MIVAGQESGWNGTNWARNGVPKEVTEEQSWWFSPKSTNFQNDGILTATGHGNTIPVWRHVHISGAIVVYM